MRRKRRFVCVLLLLSFCLVVPQISHAAVNQHVNARSAILLDMGSGSVLFEQNADYQIAPASITKILTLYLVFEAIKQGQVRLSDKVEVSRRAASTGGSRMGLKAGTPVPLEEIIKGMAVVSGNDACVAAAEHISGSVERFVKKMNAKARELGMTKSHFMTPNGLPAEGQVTTARDIAKLSVAYLRRFPESLTIHSMQAYTYGRSSHHNANRLLGKCPGVDGLKTGFVCASGYNISATAKRNGVRVLAVVMGARNSWVRCSEAERLIEAGFRETGAPYNDLKCVALASGAKGGASVSAQGGCRAGAIRKARVKKAGKQTALAARGHTNRPASKKAASNEKKKIKTAGKKSTVKNGKTPSRYASAKNKPSGVVSGKKSDRVKSAGATAKTGRNHKAKSAKSKIEEARTAAKKKNDKAIPHAHALKKRVKG